MPAGIQPGRFSSGVSTARKQQDLYGMLPTPMPFGANYYWNDFNTYVAGDWTITQTGAGTSALTASNGGVLTLTTAAVSGNNQGNQLNPASFAFTPGYQTWFDIVFTCPLNNVQNWIVGLIAGTSAVPTSGVYFTKATSSRNVQILINKAGTITTLSPATLVNAAQDAVALQLGFYYDGRPTASMYFYSSVGLVSNTTTSPSPTAFGAPPIYGGAMVASASADGLNPNPLTNLPTVNLAPAFFVQTNAASAVTMAVDRVGTATELLRF